MVTKSLSYIVRIKALIGSKRSKELENLIWSDFKRICNEQQRIIKKDPKSKALPEIVIEHV